MKLIISDGDELTVRDVGPVLVRVRRIEVPIKLNAAKIVDDDAARTVIRSLIDTGLYDHEFYRTGERGTT